MFTIYFSAPHRVDFRALVRDLAGRLSGRVELRQVGPRDEARLQGGIGPCGRDLCCATFLKDFEPVSVRMAKDQDLPVNPLRIAGACGRLMCCLKYEHPLYQDFHANAPKVGEQVDTPEGPGVVAGHNVPGDKVVVKLTADGRKCACTRASVCGSRQAYEARYGDGPQAGAAGEAVAGGGGLGRGCRWGGRVRTRSGQRSTSLLWRRRPLRCSPGAPPPPAAGHPVAAGTGAHRSAPVRPPPRRPAAGHPGRLLRAEAALAACATGSSARGCWSPSTTGVPRGAVSPCR